MRPLVLLWGCFVLPGHGALVGPLEVRGFEGDTVSLQCTYGEELKKNRKYWCRKSGLLISRCSGTIYAREDGQANTVGRVSIRDSPQKLTLNVTLTQLTLQDTGNYWCGVKILGLDETFLVSLLVLPASPGLHTTVTRAQQGKTEAEAFPFTGTPPYEQAGPFLSAGTSPHTVTSPSKETAPHKATSPHAGTSHPGTQLDSTSPEDTSLVPSRSSSKSRVSLPMIRILAPVLVLLALLLAASLAVLGRCLLRWRKEAQLSMETQRDEKVHHSHLPLGNGLVPEYAMVNLAAPVEPRASAKPSASPCPDVQGLRRTSEEEAASFQDPERDRSPGPPLPVSEEELGLSKFIAV